MKEYSNIKPKVLFILLIILSMVSTVYIWCQYQSEVVIRESIAMVYIPDSVGLKEVSFIDFVMNTVRRILVSVI